MQRFLAGLFLLGAFLVMILGMIGKVYYDHLTRNTVFSLTQILVPVIVAPMVYGAIYGAIRASTEPVPALILAFQNGFFWQDIFNGLKPPAGHTEIFLYLAALT
jgi:vacuolar-type H+-ATPase subunit I/STV1